MGVWKSLLKMVVSVALKTTAYTTVALNPTMAIALLGPYGFAATMAFITVGGVDFILMMV